MELAAGVARTDPDGGPLALLRAFPGRWILNWLLLPNLGVILMWPVGGPPMRVGLVLFGAGALVASLLPWRAARQAGLVLLTLAMTVFYICSLFRIPPLNLGLILSFLTEVRPFRSPEYLVAGLVLLASLGAALRGLRNTPRLAGPLPFLFAAGAILAFVHADRAITAPAGDAFAGLPPAGTPFESAVRQAGIGPAAAQGRHVLVVVVEALGLPLEAEEQALFAAAWDRPEWRARYAVRHGSSRFFGSTTNGELRELCGVWAHYARFDFAAADCLPARFRAAGYETQALHGFGEGFFERRDWYPRLGFQTMLFAEDLARLGVPTCGGVFPGACDAAVAPVIADRLVAARRPQFVYWLTLNSHLPVVADAALGTDGCALGSPAWRDAYPALCRMFTLHRRLADALSALALDPSLPPTDIVIVGDHRPPLFDRLSRDRFAADRVPWVHLRALDGPPR